MKFQSSNKKLRLIVKAGYREVQNGYPIDHPQVDIWFQNHFYETDDEKEIEWLKKHKMFSAEQFLPEAFWVHVPPVDKDALLASKDREIEELKAQLASKSSEPASAAAPSSEKSEGDKAPANQQASTEPATPKRTVRLPGGGMAEVV